MADTAVPSKAGVASAVLTAGLTFAYLVFRKVTRRKVQTSSMDWEKAYQLAREQTNLAWQQYDKEQAGTVDRTEMYRLVEIILKMYASNTKLLRPLTLLLVGEGCDRDTKEDTEAILSDLMWRLQGQEPKIAGELSQRVEVLPENRVARSEFCSVFNVWLERKMHEELALYF